MIRKKKKKIKDSNSSSKILIYNIIVLLEERKQGVKNQGLQRQKRKSNAFIKICSISNKQEASRFLENIDKTIISPFAAVGKAFAS